MDEATDWDFQTMNMSRLKPIRRLRESVQEFLAGDQGDEALATFRGSVRNLMLKGAEHLFFDAALKADRSQIPGLLAEMVSFESGFTEWVNAMGGGREKLLERGRELEHQINEAMARMCDMLRPLEMPALEFLSVQDVEIPEEELGVASTQPEIADYAEEHFGHRPADRSIQLWIKNGTLRTWRRGSLWGFSTRDLAAKVKKEASKKKRPAVRKKSHVSTKDKRKDGAKEAQAQRKTGENQ